MMIVERGDLVFVFNWRKHAAIPCLARVHLRLEAHARLVCMP